MIDELISFTNGTDTPAAPPPPGQRPAVEAARRQPRDTRRHPLRPARPVRLPTTVDFRRISSLGPTIATTLVKQLERSIELHRQEGSEFAIAFPDSSMS